MNTRELYAQLGEDYDEVFDRISKDEYIVKYLRKYLADDYMGMLNKALAEENWTEGFKMAHSMKGLGLNLELLKLADVSSTLCEALRGGEPKGDIQTMLKNVNDEHSRIAELIVQLD